MQSRYDLEDLFGITADHDFTDELSLQSCYNIPPTRRIPGASIGQDDERQLALFRWGLIPSWVKDLSSFKATTINARAESVATKPMYRSAFKSQRLLIPADAFYEWERSDPKNKQPYLFKRVDGEPMVFAGLFEYWQHPEGEWLASCTIITTSANEDMPIHDRMPVILERDAWDRWLDPDLHDRDELETMLLSSAPGILQHYLVDRRVGSVKNDDPSLIVPRSPEPLQGQFI